METRKLLPLPSTDTENTLKYSIIIPAKNEDMTIGDVIESAKKVLTTLEGEGEIIVIDDGSSDRTYDVASKTDAKVIRNQRSLGKGQALRQGFSSAQGEVIVTLDADGSHLPEDIPLIISPILKNQADMVIGIRDNTADLTIVHRVGNKILNALISIIALQRYHDTQSGYRSFRKGVLTTIHLKATSFEIESEMLLKIAKKGFRVIEQEIRYIPRNYGSSNINVFFDGMRIFYRLVDIILNS